MPGKAYRVDRTTRVGSLGRTLQKHHSQLAGILATASDALVVAAPDHRILFLSSGAERMLRCSASAAEGQRLSRFVPTLTLDESMSLGSRSDGPPRASRVAAVIEATRADGETFRADATIARVTAGVDSVYVVTLRDNSVHDWLAETARLFLGVIERIADTDGEAADPAMPVPDVTDIIETDHALRRLTDSLDHQARQIAQTLHDEAAQLLTPAQIALTEADRVAPPAARERIQAVREHLDQIEERLRRLAHEIRPRILDDLGLVPALDFLVESIRKRRDISISMDAAVEGRLPALVETTVYRFVQEALTNATTHGHATRIAIALERGAHALRCTIEDDGTGFDTAVVTAQPGERGLGLCGIQRQVETLGGTLSLDSTPGRGTLLTFAVPLEN
jgi:signal transduction histidine kinase